MNANHIMITLLQPCPRWMPTYHVSNMKLHKHAYLLHHEGLAIVRMTANAYIS
jgi:hypothetical protein